MWCSQLCSPFTDFCVSFLHLPHMFFHSCYHLSSCFAHIHITTTPWELVDPRSWKRYLVFRQWKHLPYLSNQLENRLNVVSSNSSWFCPGSCIHTASQLWLHTLACVCAVDYFPKDCLISVSLYPLLQSTFLSTPCPPICYGYCSIYSWVWDSLR